MRHVISAVKIIIHENFPVAGDVVGAAVEVVQFADAQRRHALHQPAKKSLQRRRLRIEIHNTNFSQVSAFTGTSPFFWRSKFLTPSNSGMPFNDPSNP